MPTTNDSLRSVCEATPRPSASWSGGIRIVCFIRSYRMVDNAEDAHDVVQEAFLSAYQSLDSFKGDSLFFTWLYRIAVNTAISLKRKQRVC